jgi:hypothetical protein
MASEVLGRENVKFVAQPKLSIDRIRIVLPLFSVAEKGAYLQIINSMKDEKGCKVWKTKDGYRLKASLPVGSSKKLLMVMGRTNGHAFASFDFNPSGLTEEERQDIRDYFSFMPHMEDGAWMSSTRTSYLEVAADCPGIWVKDVLPFVPTRRSSRWWPSSSNATPTQYLGARSSDWELRAYDRNACLKAKGIEGGSEPLLRIEVSLRKTKLCPGSLIDLPNPLLNVGLARLNDLPSLDASPEWNSTITTCWTSGSGVALSKAGKKRGLFLARLRACAWGWWDPAQLWSQFPTALMSLEDVAYDADPNAVGSIGGYGLHSPVGGAPLEVSMAG